MLGGIRHLLRQIKHSMHWIKMNLFLNDVELRNFECYVSGLGPLQNLIMKIIHVGTTNQSTTSLLEKTGKFSFRTGSVPVGLIC